MTWSRHGKHVFIELTRACNFACDFCPHPRIARPSGMMSLRDLRRVLDSLQQVPDIEYVMFSNLGEPMLHPEFEQACRLVKGFGYVLYVTTNGSLLEQRHKNTIPMDYWCISYRSTSARAFAHRGVEQSYEEYTQRIAAFINDNTQSVTIYLMGNSEWYNREADFGDALDLTNRREMEETITAIGKHFCPEFSGVEPGAELVESYIPLRPNVFLYTSRICNWAHRVLPAGYRVVPGEPRPCPFGYHQRQIAIYWNGDVSPCCLDYDGELILGNLYEDPLPSLLDRRAPIQSQSLCLDCFGTVVRA
ncbi:MAG: radical SAM protein [Candidatus Eisenbacteria sp.]|nr:radical SAM protein [Candidatus Eisenbacteria bacterium]